MTKLKRMIIVGAFVFTMIVPHVKASSLDTLDFVVACAAYTPLVSFCCFGSDVGLYHLMLPYLLKFPQICSRGGFSHCKTILCKQLLGMSLHSLGHLTGVYAQLGDYDQACLQKQILQNK